MLEDLDMKLDLCLVSFLCRLFDLQSDILDYWVDDLAQDFFPESLAEGLVMAFKNLLQSKKSISPNLLILINNHAGQIVKNREPELLLNT